MIAGTLRWRLFWAWQIQDVARIVASPRPAPAMRKPVAKIAAAFAAGVAMVVGKALVTPRAFDDGQLPAAPDDFDQGRVEARYRRPRRPLGEASAVAVVEIKHGGPPF
jgi:hypothetical protein